MGIVLEIAKKQQVSAEDSFAEFWKWYPRREKRIDAKKVWLKLSDAKRELALEGIVAFYKLWEKRRHEINFCPHATTWLNGERWEDEIVEVSSDPCGWPSCRNTGRTVRGVRSYCDAHIAALNRGETP